MKLTDEQINDAKKRTFYPLGLIRDHEHNDCIRIAYEWLDAQPKTKTCRRLKLKRIIQGWGLRYVGSNDICVAAELHPDIRGHYPDLNIGKRLIKPRQSRLDNIKTAGTMVGYGCGLPRDEIVYSKIEKEYCFL